jgi:phosphate transport system substrate-binding protein
LCGCQQETTETSVLELRCAGATFPEPLYERWFTELAQNNGKLKIDYNAVGSAAAIEQLTDELVDFSATEDALSDQAIAQIDRGARLLPMTSGAIVLAYNLKDTAGQPIPELRLSRKAYADIYLGKVQSWNDEEIARHNPGVALPDAPIQVEYRLDGSGPTLVFTRHLSALSDEWKNGPGIGLNVDWPVGAGMPMDKGIVRALKQTPGSIGYLSYPIALQAKIPMATLENKAGQFVKPTLETIGASLKDSPKVPEDLRMTIPDPSGANAYPIVTYSWIVCYRTYDDPEKLRLLKEALTYCLQQGQGISGGMGYVPLPEDVAHSALAELDKISLPQSAAEATSAAPVVAAAEGAASPTAVAPVTRAELAQEEKEASAASKEGEVTAASAATEESAEETAAEDAAADDTAVKDAAADDKTAEVPPTDLTPPDKPPGEADAVPSEGEGDTVHDEESGIPAESPEKTGSS